MRKCLGILITSTLLASITHAQSRIYVNEYLNIGVGARGLAMGGTQSASTNDVYSAFWNPAGLNNVNSDAEIGLMHAEYFAGIFKYDYAAAAIPINKKKQVIGVSFIRFATDNIPYTIDYVQPDGSFDDSQLKGFSAGDYAVLLSYAQALNIHKKNTNWNTAFGVNGKIIYRNVGKMANAWGAGIDIGLQTNYKQRLKFGLSLKDISTSYTAWSFNLTDKEKEVFYNTGNEVPIKSYEIMLPRFNFGVGYNFFKLTNSFQVYGELGFDITTDGQRTTLINSSTVSVDPRIGVEISYKNTIFLRGGVSNFYQAMDNADSTNNKKYTVFQPSVGVGFKVKSLNIDYAFTSLRMQDNPLMSHIISLRIDLNKSVKKTTVEPQPAQTNNSTTNTTP